jgi:c-di-GMP-binding flagellar brake protein YcgR
MRRRGDKQPDRQPGPPAEGGQPGKLKSPSGEQWPVRVGDREGDELMLVLLTKHDQLGAGEASEPLVLECTSQHGVIRFAGQAVVEESDLVRFRVEDPPEVEQRRQFVRVVAPRQVVLAVLGEGTIDRAYSLDVSGGGMLLSGPESLKVGDRIRFRLQLDSGTPAIKGRGRVVRCAGEAQRGISFEEIDPVDRDRLIRFIFQRQRESRARDNGLG